jgi:hypothetical protein
MTDDDALTKAIRERCGVDSPCSFPDCQCHEWRASMMHFITGWNAAFNALNALADSYTANGGTTETDDSRRVRQMVKK